MVADGIIITPMQREATFRSLLAPSVVETIRGPLDQCMAAYSLQHPSVVIEDSDGEDGIEDG